LSAGATAGGLTDLGLDNLGFVDFWSIDLGLIGLGHCRRRHAAIAFRVGNVGLWIVRPRPMISLRFFGPDKRTCQHDTYQHERNGPAPPHLILWVLILLYLLLLLLLWFIVIQQVEILVNLAVLLQQLQVGDGRAAAADLLLLPITSWLIHNHTH